MLLSLAQWLQSLSPEWGFLRVFQYITFRAVMAALTALLIGLGAGPFVIRRLTKAEYGNTLHDLYGVDAAVARGLPDEVFGAGYLNTLSPLQSEQYLGIANAVVDRIVAPADAPPPHSTVCGPLMTTSRS